jgi:hypothetical protein
VLGKDGSTLKNLIQESGAQVRVDPKRHVVLFSGEGGCVAKANALMQKALGTASKFELYAPRLLPTEYSSLCCSCFILRICLPCRKLLETLEAQGTTFDTNTRPQEIITATFSSSPAQSLASKKEKVQAREKVQAQGSAPRQINSQKNAPKQNNKSKQKQEVQSPPRSNAKQKQKQKQKTQQKQKPQPNLPKELPAGGQAQQVETRIVQPATAIVWRVFLCPHAPTPCTCTLTPPFAHKHPQCAHNMHGVWFSSLCALAGLCAL